MNTAIPSRVHARTRQAHPLLRRAPTGSVWTPPCSRACVAHRYGHVHWHVHWRVHRYVYGHVNGRVHGNIYIYVCGHVHRHVYGVWTFAKSAVVPIEQRSLVYPSAVPHVIALCVTCRYDTDTYMGFCIYFPVVLISGMWCVHRPRAYMDSLAASIQ